MTVFRIPNAEKGLNVAAAYACALQKYLLLSEAVSDGETLSAGCVSLKKCGFCRNWNHSMYMLNRCLGCPIRHKTQQPQCWGTPYGAFQRAVLLRRDVTSPLVDMIVFLLELEPAVASMEKMITP